MEIFSDISETNVVWQVDVYNEARAVAERLGLQKIIDIGCGSGDKLCYYFDSNLYNTVGVDFLSSLSHAKEQYPDRRWVACDITHPVQLRRTFADLGLSSPAVIILSDVIEHLFDLRPLLSEIRSFMEKDERSRLIISTPDRSRLTDRDPDGLPPNPAHVREWNLEELAALFKSAGFIIERAGHTRANQFDDHYSTSFLELSFNRVQYLTWLTGQGIIRGGVEPSHLLITTEFQGLGPSGGIGTVVEQQRRAYPAGYALVVHLSAIPSAASERLEHDVLSPADLFDDPHTLALPLEDQALHTLQQLLFYFPNLKTVQYQDYAGVGCRIAQASKAGMLPDSLRTVVHCHGAVHYLENGQEEWIGLAGFGVAEREKIAIELANTVVFPSRFLHDLYDEAGIGNGHPDRRILGYPYDFSSTNDPNFQEVDTLIFVGKRTRMKGFTLFLEALSGQGIETVRAAGIERIIIIGPLGDSDPNTQLQLDHLRHTFYIEEYANFNRFKLLDFVARWTGRSLFVLPYLADNQPLTVFDIVGAGGLPVMLNAGGIPEMLPEVCSLNLLAEPNANSLRERILRLAKTSAVARAECVLHVRQSAMLKQQEVRQAILELGTVKIPDKSSNPYRLTATVVVPYFNTDLKYVQDLIWALNQQTMWPKEVIFVDDASEAASVDALEALAKRELKLPWRVIRHASNKGLAGARNTALFAAESDILINLDSDDVPHNNFVRDILWCFAGDPENVAAVPYLEAFDDGAEYNYSPHVGYVYRPTGAGLITGQTENVFGHANSGFRVDVLRRLGGWDEKDKSKYEDWALYLRLASRGLKIGIIPQAGCLYRVRSSSMVRTYGTWPAWRRLARSVDVLPRYEAFRLQALARDHLRASQAEIALMSELAELRRECNVLVSQRHALQAQINRRSFRLVSFADRTLRSFPHIFNLTYALFVIGWRSGAKLRRVLRGH